MGAFLKRCRPLLGTFVEVSLEGVSETEQATVFTAAFSAIEDVAKTMSFHDPDSALSHLNRAPVGDWVEVGAALAEVLSLALTLQEQSGGVFNVAVADTLVAWGLMPGASVTTDWQHLAAPAFAVQGHLARRLAPVRLDLGGIAKGYAVDCAVSAIKKLSPHAGGCVNAGGDLRVFGTAAQPVWIRVAAERDLRLTELHEEALATSSVIPSKVRGDEKVSPYVDTKGQRALVAERTVSVRAARCMIADALTKIALCLPAARANELASGYGAEVYHLS